MNVSEFVDARLVEFYQRPQMWAGTKEAFGLQLVLLVEIFFLNTAAQAAQSNEHSRKLMPLIFGPGNTVSPDRLDDEWARERVVIVRRYLKETS